MRQNELRDYALTLTDTNSINAMKTGKTVNGFYLTIGKLDFFIVSDRKNKTDKLASDILRKLLLPNNPDTRKEVLYWLVKATCKKLENVNFYSVKDSCGSTVTDELLVISL